MVDCEYCDALDECTEDCSCPECCESHDQPCMCDGCVDRRVDYAESMRDAYD